MAQKPGLSQTATLRFATSRCRGLGVPGLSNMARHTKRRGREKRPLCWKLDHSSSLDQSDQQHS